MIIFYKLGREIIFPYNVTTMFLIPYFCIRLFVTSLTIIIFHNSTSLDAPYLSMAHNFCIIQSYSSLLTTFLSVSLLWKTSYNG